MLISLLMMSALAPQSPEPVSTSVRNLPTLGIQVRDERLLDRASGRIVRRTTDAATGAVVDGDALLVEEARARDLASGKISHELAAVLAGEQEKIKVVFWMERDAGHPDLRNVLDAALAAGMTPEDARRAALGVAAEHAARLIAPLVDAATTAGHEVTYIDPYVPIVFVELAPGDVAALAARPDVDQVYYSFPKWESEIEGEPVATVFNQWASPSARTDHVHRKGINGAGVKVMVNDPNNVVSTNPFLPTVVLGNGASAASHATAVAGIISSNHTLQTGAAPGLNQMYSYGASGDQGAPMAWAWGMQQGISFGNCSWWNFNRGAIVFLDRYFDYIIRNFGVMMFKSCGNQGNGQPVTTPGNGFNMTSSGCADDRNSHDWDDDILASFSSTGNPQPSDHEKPELAAHGTGIFSTTTGGTVGSVGSGTSYASPVTCGSAALLAETDTALQAKPEVVKAVLMAGAWNNIHGAAPLSDYDGAGGIDAAASQAAIADGQYVSTTLTTASFLNGIWSTTMFLDGGDETRLVALWFSVADSSYSTDVLQMDLDMTVEDPGGVVVATSASSKNPFEIVSFVPPSTGTYTLKLHMQRFQGTSEPLAVAWTTSQDAATDVVSFTGTPRVGTTLGVEFFDRYHPGAIYVSVLSTTPYPATWSLPPNKLIPMGFDGLSASSLVLLPGFVGTLPANGRATTTLAIPPAPGLAGLTIYAAMLTLESGVAEAEEISGVSSFTIVP